MHTLSKIILGFCLFGLTSATLVRAQVDPTMDPGCRDAQVQLRKLFMDYDQSQGINLKYLEDQYYTCEAPHPRSTIIYYYLKSATLLKVDGNYVEPPSDMFRYFYREFNEASKAAPEVAQVDPEFGRLLEIRTNDLTNKLAIAEKSGDKAVLGAASSSSSEVAGNNLQNDPIFGSEAAAGTRSLSPPRGASSEDYGEVKEGDFPYYPLPVETRSAQMTLPNRAFQRVRSLGEVDAKLQSILNNHGYYTRDYFSVPDGFCLVTQMERIHPDGAPEDDWERWKTAVTLNKTFALREYFLSLVFAQPGFYRAFAFVLTPQEMLTDPWAGAEHLNKDLWRSSGGAKVPPTVGALPFGENYQMTVFVYEFEVPASEESARLVVSSDQGGKGLSAQQHLVAAGLWDELTK